MVIICLLLKDPINVIANNYSRNNLSVWNYTGTQSPNQFQSVDREWEGKDKIVPLNSGGNLIYAAVFIIFIYVVERPTTQQHYAAFCTSWVLLYLLCFSFFPQPHLFTFINRNINSSNQSQQPIVRFYEKFGGGKNGWMIEKKPPSKMKGIRDSEMDVRIRGGERKILTCWPASHVS